MSIRSVRDFPTVISNEMMENHLAGSALGIHESCLRSWHILNRVKDYLAKGTPPSVVLEIVEEMEKE